MTSTPISGERLRLLRQASDLSQKELAHRLHLDGNSQVSKLENGRLVPDASLLTRLTRSLNCSAEFLSRTSPDLIATRPWLRAYADAPTRTVDFVTADNLLHYEAVSLLGLKRIPERIPVFDGDLRDPDAIEDFALEVRSAAEVEDGSPVTNAVRSAERLGCVVLPLRDELGRHLGLSQYIDSTPYLRVSRPRPGVPGDRQRFTVAHELGHLALHPGVRPPASAEEARAIEGEAHRFAGAFLAPREPLLEELSANGGRVTLNTLMQLKAAWGVAIKMLIKRLRQLDVIGDSQATLLYKQVSKRGWNTGEPVHVSPEKAIWMTRALEKKWPSPNPASMAAHELGLGETYVSSWLDWSEPVEYEGALLDLRQRADATGLRSEREEGDRPPASVIRLRG